MMKVVITGGNGYIGARLSIFLANKGYQVIPVCFPTSPNNKEWKDKMFDVFEGDIRQEETILKISEFKPDILIHLVSLDHYESENEPGFVSSVNITPTWRLLDICTKGGLKKFIYFSTIQVYGKLENSIIEEKHPFNTVNAYGLTHHLCETFCDYYNRKTDTNVIAVRLSNSYGDPVFEENNCWWLAINDLCKSAYLNEEIRLLSDGTPQRDFIHGNDVCEAVNILIKSDKNTVENVYHISSGNTLTLMELARIVREEYYIRYNKLLPIITPQGLYDSSKVIISEYKFTISNEKLKSLGFLPNYSINRGVRELFDFFENKLNKK